MKKILTAILFVISINLVAQDSTHIPISIPKFKNGKVQKFAKEYLVYIGEYIKMARNPSAMDSKKLEKWVEKGQSFSAKMQEISTITSSSSEEAKKFADFLVATTNYMQKELSLNSENTESMNAEDSLFNEEAYNTIDTPIIEDFIIPEFENPEVQKFVIEYSAFVKKTNFETSDQREKEQISNKMVEFTIRMTEIELLLRSNPEEFKKFDDYMMRLNFYKEKNTF